MQFLDVITMKDPNQKANFYRGTLIDALPYIPKVLCQLLSSQITISTYLQYLRKIKDNFANTILHFVQFL